MKETAGPASRATPARATSRRPDGRTARGERTRKAIVEALLALLAEGDQRAAPERIVERAGVSLRTLWTNFKDLEHAYGFGFRFNTDNGTILRIDAGFGSTDGKHLYIVFGDVF